MKLKRTSRSTNIHKSFQSAFQSPSSLLSCVCSQDGRAPSGILVCAMFCFCHLFNNPIPAMQLLSAKRPGSGLWPSHRRSESLLKRMWMQQSGIVGEKKMQSEEKWQRSARIVAGIIVFQTSVWLRAPFNSSCVAAVMRFIYHPIKVPEHRGENNIKARQNKRGAFLIDFRGRRKRQYVVSVASQR